MAEKPDSDQYPTLVVRTRVWQILLLIAAGVVCYGNSFSAPFIFDDYDAIVNNQDVFGSLNLRDFLLHGGSRRIADFSFAVNFKLHGLHVAGYHIVNLAIHLLSTVTLYFLCIAVLDALDLQMSPKDPDTNNTAGTARHFIPLATALFFVCHPLQTQAVTYIVQRYTSLTSLFYLLALLAFVKGRTVFELRRLTAAVYGWGILLIVMTLLGMYTKPLIFSLPFMILMLEYCLFEGRMFRYILLTFGAAVVLLVSVIIAPGLLNGSFANSMLDLDHATSEDLYSSRTSYFLTQLRVIVTYLRLLIVPVLQRLDYDYPEYDSLLNSEVAASLALHVALMALAVVLFVRSRRQKTPEDGQRGPFLRLITIGIAWFYIALSVESSFIPITDVIMEHRVYLPSAGLFMAISTVILLLAQKFRNGTRYQWLGLTALCLTLSVMTIKRNQVWGDELRFWRYEADLSPRSGRVLANLGLEYLDRGNHEQAVRIFVDAVKREPNLVDVWIMLGHALEGLDQFQGRFLLNDAYLTPDGDVDYQWYNQFYSNEFNNMGLANEFIGRPEEALTWYKKSLAVNPKSDLAWYNLGLLAAHLGMFGQADLALAKLSEINPQLAGALKKNRRPASLPR
jgi:tetratricopeptide (TPR) repeat protein